MKKNDKKIDSETLLHREHSCKKQESLNFYTFVSCVVQRCRLLLFT